MSGAFDKSAKKRAAAERAIEAFFSVRSIPEHIHHLRLPKHMFSESNIDPFSLPKPETLPPEEAALVQAYLDDAFSPRDFGQQLSFLADLEDKREFDTDEVIQIFSFFRNDIRNKITSPEALNGSWGVVLAALDDAYEALGEFGLKYVPWDGRWDNKTPENEQIGELHRLFLFDSKTPFLKTLKEWASQSKTVATNIYKIEPGISTLWKLREDYFAHKIDVDDIQLDNRTLESFKNLADGVATLATDMSKVPLLVPDGKGSLKKQSQHSWSQTVTWADEVFSELPALFSRRELGFQVGE